MAKQQICFMPQRVISLEKGTCSDRATKRWLRTMTGAENQHLSVERVESFGLAVKALKGGAPACLLIPHLHKLSRTLSLKPGISVDERLSFWLPNPILYLAEGKSASRTCAAITALRPLVTSDSAKLKFRFVNTDSTQTAARAAAEGQVGFCVTNAYGLLKYRLKPIRRLKHMNILWLAFVAHEKELRR